MLISLGNGFNCVVVIQFLDLMCFNSESELSLILLGTSKKLVGGCDATHLLYK